MLNTISASEKEILHEIKDRKPESSPVFGNCDDVSCAALFCDIYAPVLCYCIEMKSWLSYTGEYWKPRRDDSPAHMAVMRFSRALRHYAIGIDSNGTRTPFQKYCDSLGNNTRRNYVVNDVRTILSKSATLFDQDSCLLNMKNGVIDLRGIRPGKEPHLTPHRYDQYLMKTTGISYDPTATAPAWEKFIDEITEGNAEVIQYLQTILGKSLIGGNKQDEMYIFAGLGRNGKSVLMSVIQAAFGDVSNPVSSYTGVIDPEVLAAKKTHDGQKCNPELAKTRGLRLLRTDEPRKDMILDSSLVKSLLGRDPVSPRELYSKSITFVPMFHLFMLANSMPVISDPVVFTSGRVKVVRFNRVFSEEEQRQDLRDVLEKELPGIMNWLLVGLAIYHKDNDRIKVPQIVRQWTEEYSLHSDKIGEFIAEQTRPAPGNNVMVKFFYQHYASWCKRNGYNPGSKRSVQETLKLKHMYRPTGTVNKVTVHNIVPDIEIIEDPADN